MVRPGIPLSVDVTTTGLVASIKRRGFIPSGSGLSDAEILLYATEELRSYITAFLKGIREEFIVSTLDLVVTGGTIEAPARAVGAALRTIGWVMSNGQVRQLPRIEPEQSGQFIGQTGDPICYEFQGNNFILMPTPSSGTLRLTYQQRPGQLVATTACGRITTINTTTHDVTVAVKPSTFLDDTLYDFVSGTANFQTLKIDANTAGNYAWSSAVVNMDPAADDLLVSVGDYICLAQETCIPQVPIEVHDLLAQATAYKIAQATGSARMSAIKSGLDDLHMQMTQILSPRSDGSARPIVSRSRIGTWNMGF